MLIVNLMQLCFSFWSRRMLLMIYLSLFIATRQPGGDQIMLSFILNYHTEIASI
jgi:hypothetical protein